MAVFSALRVYALWDRSSVLFIIVFALGMVPMGTDMVSCYLLLSYAMLIK